MARRGREAGTLKLCILGAAMMGALALPAQADDKLDLSANVALTTDYIFRGFSQTAENPAIQGGFDATWKFLYVGVWASNVDFGALPSVASGNPKDVASIEIDWYGGIRPTWQGFTFDVGVIYYTYPGACDSKCVVGAAPGSDLDYVELKTGISYTFAEKLTVGVVNYWTDDNTGGIGENDVLELGAGYAFGSKLFNFFSPSVSGLVGWQWGDESKGGFDYTYWNIGLTLGFLEKFSADVRYWDTDISGCTGGVLSCDERVVGTLKAAF
jgi:uncharacterized protein (TIGR02001 family)